MKSEKITTASSNLGPLADQFSVSKSVKTSRWRSSSLCLLNFCFHVECVLKSSNFITHYLNLCLLSTSFIPNLSNQESSGVSFYNLSMKLEDELTQVKMISKKVELFK